MPTDPAIIADELTKRFEEEAGVFDLDLRVERGRIVALIGPSGSGKTTTVRLMTGLLAPDSGSISVLGQDPTRFTPETRSRIGYMAQDSVFFPDLTLRENLNFAASLFGVPLRRKRRVNEIVELLDLGEAFDRLLRDVSGGEKRRLSLAATLIHGPELLFLDEPTADRPNLALLRDVSGGEKRRLSLAASLIHAPSCCSSTSRPRGSTQSCGRSSGTISSTSPSRDRP